MQRRLEHLDLLRLLAVALVMFGHYVSVAGGATSIPLIIGDNFTLPLIDSSKWQLWRFEVFLITKFSTQTAILGVSLFFLITGYLMPVMMDRYTRSTFLVNRVFRILPILFVAMILLGVFVGATQGIFFNWSSYLASWTLTYPIFGVIPVSGVLWTLLIEVLFYACACLIGSFSIHKLFFLQINLLAIILFSDKLPNEYFLMLAATQAKYLLMITVGSAIFLAEKEDEWHKKISLVLGSIFLSYLGFQLYKYGHEDTSTYNNLGTQLLALTLFLLFHWLATFGLFKKLPAFIFWMSDLVYPIYLLHAAIGLGTMALLRPLNNEPYFLLAGALTSSISLSWVLHVSVEKPGILIGKRLTKGLNAKVSN
ncbi:MAG: acyltransferase family protein [Burkholderiales bacterium]|nr:acyltransferase family protein [Burkholderiales bacterium]